jgi:diguanylate cyclase (GGDEF)-like protein/PAS domain S-box-containing protein
VKESAVADEAQSARLLAGLARRIASSLDLQETLQMVVQSVVDQLSFGAAVVNMARPGDVCEVVAVAGSDDATEALMGTRAPMEAWYELLAACEAWGELRFLDHSSDQSSVGPIPSWTPPTAPVDEPGAWHPDDSLFAPLYAPDGTLIGVLSVDEPPGGLLPDAASCRLLEQFALHAALAIEHARVHTLVADSERLFRAMFDRSPIAIALLTEDQRITRVNVAFEKLLGRASAELIGTVAAELTRPDQIPARRAADGPASSRDPYEVHFARPDGSEVWGRVSSTELTVEGGTEPRVVLTQIEDITILRTIQARFAYAATHDRLTGLANRALVLDRLAAALAEAERGRDRVAAFYCDLDHFKEINDTLGHAAGDQLLAEVARRLELTARERDTVGRLGGDEFVVIAYPVPSAAEAACIATRLMGAVQHPLELGGEKVSPTASIGAALSEPGTAADQLIADADRAMYAAKAAGGDRWRLATGGLPRTPGGAFRAKRIGNAGRDDHRPLACERPVTRSGSVRGPRTCPAAQVTAAGSARVNSGKRSSQASSATRSSIRARCDPRQRWTPRPNAACRLTSRSMTISSARSNSAGSRLAAGYDSRIQSSAFMSAPRQCMSCLTSRAMVTGA